MRELNWPTSFLSQNPNDSKEDSDQKDEWLSLALQSAEMSAYKWDLETNVITRAKNSSIHPGIREGSNSWMYKEGIDNVYPEDRERVIGAVQAAIKNKSTFNVEFRVQLPNQKVRWLLTKGHAIYGAHDVPLYVLAVTQEITEKKEVELQLENQKRELEMKRSQLSIALEGAGMVVLTNINTSSKFASPELCKIFGFDEENTIFDFELIISRIHPEDRDRVIASVEKSAREGGLIHNELRIVLPNGEIRWLLVKGTSVMSNEGGRDFLVLQDITAQKLAQEQILIQQQELKIISNSMPQLAWISDNTGALTWVNQKVVEYSGIPTSDLLGWGHLQMHDPKIREKTFEKIKIHLKEGLPWEDTFPLRSRNNEWRWFLSRAEPIRDSRQKIVRWIGTNTDVTKERELTKNLESQKLTREQFTSALTHDLKNPLSAISIALQMISKNKGNIDQMERLTKTAINSATRMERMIENLLDANRLEAGEQVRFDMASFDLTFLLKQIIDDLSLSYEVPFVFTEVGECWGFWNQDALRRVFENLLTNAVKYGDKISDITIQVKRIQNNKRIEIEVHNKGKAIPASDQARIFEMHHRVDETDTGRPKGWGIGLTLVKGIVTAHGGTITVASEENTGTTFKVSLPIGKASQNQ